MCLCVLCVHLAAHTRKAVITSGSGVEGRMSFHLREDKMWNHKSDLKKGG